MRDLEDPDNPYLGQYAEWDRWLLDNARNPSMEEMAALRDGTAPEGFFYLRPSVTDDGWLIPQLSELESLLRRQTDLEAFRNRPSCIMSFSSAGVADPAMLERLEAARLALWRSLLPAIPDWLAAALPKRAILLPDGGAVTYGPLGSGMQPVAAAQWRYDAEGNPEVYYRYDAAGNEVARSTPGLPWQELFAPGFTEVVLLGGSRLGLIPVTLNGYTILSSQADGAVVAVYDYSGELLPTDTPVGSRPGGIVVELDGEYLGKIAAGAA